MLDILLNKIGISISRARKNIKFNSIKYSGLIKSAGAMFGVLYGPQVLTANTGFFSTNKAQTEQNEALPSSFNPDNPEYNIQGSVLNTNQQPVSDIPLYLINFENGVAADTLAQAVSSMSGEFEFVNLANSINPPTPIPTNFRVSENYPNPVRTNTTLDLEIVTPGNYTLTKVNTLGQVVSRTTFSHVPSGVHQINMDVRGLASGAYFYKITGPDEQRTGSMVVINNNIVGGSSPGVVLNQGAGDKNNIEDIMNMSGVRSYSEDFDLRITTPKTSEYEASETPVNTGSSLQIVNITLESLAQLYALSGQVKNADDEVLVGKELKIKDSDDSIIASTFTDENGLYSFEFETSDTNLSLKKPETEFYEEQRIPLNLQQGENTLDITALDKFVLSIIEGSVFNARDEGVQGVSVTNEYGSATTNSQGDYALQLEHEKRKQGHPTTLMFSHPNYNTKQKEASLQNQTLNALLDIILQENNFVLKARTVNFDDETMPFVLKYLNEAGTDSVEVNLTPNNGVINVNFSNWPGEDAVLYNTSSSDMSEEDQRLDIMALRTMDQIPLALNTSQSKTGEPLYLPLQTLNDKGEMLLLTIPKYDTYESIATGGTVTLNVQDFLHTLLSSRASSPAGTVRWAPEETNGELDTINIRVVGYNLTTGEPVSESTLQDNFHVMDQVSQLYQLNDGSTLFPYTTGFLETQEDVQDFANNVGVENSILLFNEHGNPGNTVQYKQRNIQGQNYWLLNRGWTSTSGSSVGTTLNEAWESKSNSDDTAGGLNSFGPSAPSISNLGKTAFRAIQFLNPQTEIPPYTTSSSQTNLNNKSQKENIEDAIILKETNYN